MWLREDRKKAIERYFTVREEFPYEFQFTWESEGGKSSDELSIELYAWLEKNAQGHHWIHEGDGIGYSTFILMKDPAFAMHFRLKWSGEYEKYTNHSSQGKSEA